MTKHLHCDKILNFQTNMASYTTEERGSRNSVEYRLFFKVPTYGRSSSSSSSSSSLITIDHDEMFRTAREIRFQRCTTFQCWQEMESTIWSSRWWWWSFSLLSVMIFIDCDEKDNCDANMCKSQKFPIMIIPGAPMDKREDGDWFEVGSQPDQTRCQEGKIEVLFKFLIKPIS